MKKKKKIIIPSFVKHPSEYDGVYYKGVETKDFIFYCNYKEGDENANTVMYDRKMKLLSANYFAFTALWDALSKNEYTHLSPYMKKVLKMPEIQEQMKEWVEED